MDAFLCTSQFTTSHPVARFSEIEGIMRKKKTFLCYMLRYTLKLSLFSLIHLYL